MEELDLKELISIFLERKLLIILVVIIFSLIGAIYTFNFITPIYRSSTSVILTQTGLYNSSGESAAITQSDITLNAKLVDNYKKIAESRVVTRKVIENLGISATIDEIKASTVVSTSTENEVIQITVSNTDPELACDIANETAKVLIEKALEFYKVDNANILDEAIVSQVPANVNLFKNIAIFAFIGGILVSGYILLINMLDTTVKTDLDIERATNLPVLGSIIMTGDSTKRKKASEQSGKRTRTSLDISFDHAPIKPFQEYDNLNKEDADDSTSRVNYESKVGEEKKDNRNYTNSKSNSNSTRNRNRYNNNRKGNKR